ncbi:hypothetical protein AALO_G00046220 [Alosa alosa]|uniref:Uncharacterized protein n=1 Tax=Alosa alosa TaxID=278164 RepID=A0AAV6H8S5_9TELE|nr:hypothetical protein AALO_G00046220 [Alosa alosa]
MPQGQQITIAFARLYLSVINMDGYLNPTTTSQLELQQLRFTMDPGDEMLQRMSCSLPMKGTATALEEKVLTGLFSSSSWWNIQRILTQGLGLSSAKELANHFEADELSSALVGHLRHRKTDNYDYGGKAPGNGEHMDL